MRDHSPDEQALIRIQQDWAEARVKGDSSYTRRLEVDDCTIVWPDGRVVNKKEDLQTMTGDIVLANSRSTICKCAFMAKRESWSAREKSAHNKEDKIC